MDHVRGPGGLRLSLGHGDVGGDFRRHPARLCHRTILLGAGQALSGRRQFVPIRGEGLSEHHSRLSLLPDCEVRNRMGLASLLLGISGRDGRDHGRHDRLHRGHSGPGSDERGRARPGIHGVHSDHFRLRRLVHRISRRQRIDQRQPRHQHHPDRRAAVFLRARDRVPAGPSRGLHRLYPGRHQESPALRTERGRPVASQRLVGRPAAQLQLADAADDHRDPAAGGFESITSLGEEAKDPKRDIPRGVLLSLTIQCLFCT